MKEVCIGDDITSLSVKFDEPIASGFGSIRSLPLNEVQVERVMAKLNVDRSIANKIGRAWEYGKFDRESIPLLKNITAVCELKVFSTQYLSESGHVTRVNFEPRAFENSAKQLYIVTSITRTLPRDMTGTQYASIEAELKIQYGKLFNPYPLPKGTGKVTLVRQVGFSDAAVILESKFVSAQKRIDELRAHPTCSGGGIIKLN